jgi:hypothetical protein
MGVEPLPGLRITIRADLDVRAGRFMIHNVPTLPAGSAVRRILGRPILLLLHKIPFPRSFLLREPFPGLVPQLVWTHVSDDFPPDGMFWSDPRRSRKEVSLMSPPAMPRPWSFNKRSGMEHVLLRLPRLSPSSMTSNIRAVGWPRPLTFSALIALQSLGPTAEFFLVTLFPLQYLTMCKSLR